MRIRAHGIVHSHPEFSLAVKSQPFAVDAHAEGSLKLSAGPIAARIDAIPLTVVIPFLHRRTAQIVGTIGPFNVHVEQFDAEVRAFGVHFAGVLGKEGMQCQIDGRVACRMEMDLDGEVPGRITRASIELVPEEHREHPEGGEHHERGDHREDPRNGERHE